MSDFIHNKQWLMPPFISLNYPASVDKIGQVPIPLYEDVDKAVWTNSTNDILSFKDAFLHVQPAGQSTHRRVIYNKMPTDEHVKVGTVLQFQCVAFVVLMRKPLCTFFSISLLLSLFGPGYRAFWVAILIPPLLFIYFRLLTKVGALS